MSRTQETLTRKRSSDAATMQRDTARDQRHDSEPQEVGVPRWLHQQHTSDTCAPTGDNKQRPGLQTKLRISEPGDAYEQEADRVADQVLATPGNAEVGKAPPRIQRFAAEPAGQANTVPASVDQALVGFGTPLEPALQQDMETRFAHDFSDVRIHSDPIAEQSARDVGANAYTVGQDVVFGEGRFAPGTNEGRRLLAHELTHVVQQSGAEESHAGRADEKTGSSPVPTRSAGGHVLARDAEVDLPGWGSPLIGDDDSDVTFTPSADFRTADFERDIRALANEDYLAQFYRQELGRKAGEYDDSSMSERGGYQGALRIKAGTKGVVRIAVHAHFFFDEKWNNTYDQYVACSWEVAADLKGKLQIGKPRPEVTPIGDDEAPFQLANLNPDQDQDLGSVQISPQFVSYQFTDIPNFTVGGNFDFGEEGKGRRGGMSGSIIFGNEQTYPPGQLVRTFNLNLRVTDIPPPPDPTGKVVIGPISMQNTHKVLFPPPKRGKGQDAVSGTERDTLIYWCQHLNDETKKQIQAGVIPISLEGHASTTGDTGMNLDLSQRRMDNVKNILSTFVGNRAVFETRSAGKYEAKTPDETESDEERTVIVSLWEQVFQGESTTGP
jgi:Domain of unknown function (DUF4157)